MKNKSIQVLQRKAKFSIIRETAELSELMESLPKDEIFKFISNGGFSSIAFVSYVCGRTKIKEMTASTLRAGKKHLQYIDAMHKNGRIGTVRFIIGSIVRDDSKKLKAYGYYEQIEKVCNSNGWELIVQNNHSKIILFDTEDGKFVLETSSNLNENPKREQFSFEQNADLYEFYLEALKQD